MTRLCSLTLCAGLAVGVLSCGSNGSTETSKGALDIVPADSAVSGWKIDLSANKNANGAPMTATSKAQAIGLIDGGAEPFFPPSSPSTPKVFVQQNYTNSTLAAAQPDGAKVLLYVLEMASADDAKGLYSAVLSLSDYKRKQGTEDDWKATDTVVGDESRIEDTGSTWWINFRKGVFYVEVVLTPSTGPEPDYTPHDVDTKKEAMRFAQAVLAKM
jgi:hypothetical protein